MYLSYRRCRRGSYNVALSLWKRGPFCCSVWLRRSVSRAVAGSGSVRLHCRCTNKRPCGGNRRAAARQLARAMRASALPHAQMSLLSLSRSCRVKRQRCAGPCVRAEALGRLSAADGGQNVTGAGSHLFRLVCVIARVRVRGGAHKHGFVVELFFRLLC